MKEIVIVAALLLAAMTAIVYVTRGSLQSCPSCGGPLYAGNSSEKDLFCAECGWLHPEVRIITEK